MIHFVLCDDNPRHNQTLHTHLEDILPNLPVEADIALVTTSPGKVIRYAQAPHEQTVFLLDLVLEQEQSGLDVCRAIREADDQALVIYVSAYAEYAMDCLETHAYDFVLKPYTAERLENALQDAVRAMIAHNDIVPLQVTSGSVTRVLDQKEIYYLQTQREYVTAYTSRGPMTWHESMTRLMDRLNPEWFVRIHKSYTMNRLHLKSVDAATQQVSLEDGTVLPISRRCLKAFDSFCKKQGDAQSEE